MPIPPPPMPIPPPPPIPMPPPMPCIPPPPMPIPPPPMPIPPPIPMPPIPMPPIWPSIGTPANASGIRTLIPLLVLLRTMTLADLLLRGMNMTSMSPRFLASKKSTKSCLVTELDSPFRLEALIAIGKAIAFAAIPNKATRRLIWDLDMFRFLLGFGRQKGRCLFEQMVWSVRKHFLPNC